MRGRAIARKNHTGTKLDAAPVSEADEAAERMIGERLAEARPDDGIIGEFGASGSTPSTNGLVNDAVLEFFR